MKKFKTIGIVVFVLMLVFQLSGCGSSKVADSPQDELIKSDVQDYITEIIDESGEIKIFEKTESNVDGDEAVAKCTALFSSSSGDQQGEFTLTYSLDGGEWKLEKCKVELSEEETGSSASAGHTPDEEDTEEQTEATEEETEEAAGEAEKTDEKASKGSSGGAKAGSGKSEIIAGYTVEESGSCSNDNRLLQNYGTMYYVEDDCARIVATNGETLKEPYTHIEALGEGYMAVAKKSDDVNRTGLIKTDGKELIPCEAAIIERISNKRGGNYNGRYMRVVYGEGTTTDKEKAFFYTTDKQFSFSADDADTLYTGYARVYDTVKEQFVPGVQSDNPDEYSIKECGDHFFIEDQEGIYYLYDENGKEILQSTKINGIGNGYFIISDEGMYEVYDETGEKLLSSKDMYTDMESESGYLKIYENSNYVMIDKNGDQILPDTYKSISSESKGLVSVQSVTGEYQLVNLKGEVLGSTNDMIAPISEPYSDDSGYYYAKNDDKFDLIGPGGMIVSGLEECPTHCIVMKDTDALVINDGEFSLHMDNKHGEDLGLGLIGMKSDSNGKFGVIDLFTGEQLLDYEYDNVYGIDGYIYALKGDTWTIYKLGYKYY